MMRNNPTYKLNQNGEFVIENFNLAKPFANFFPAIAGKYGIPIWVFYVNRGQAISCFGSKDKDHPILEFFPANKAWQMTPLQGFRTFIKVNRGKQHSYYEPFSSSKENLSSRVLNRMFITSCDLRLEEDNLALGLKTNVEYFTLPNENFGALVRILTVKNTASGQRRISLLDGLPQIVPFGTNNFFLKKMSRTIEAWMRVENLKEKAPFYKLSVDPQDRPEVLHIKEGNFYLAFHYQNARPELISPLTDPAQIFGPITDFTLPYNFLCSNNFASTTPKASQAKMPCGFMAAEFKLKSQESKTFYSCIGYMLNREVLNLSLPRIIKSGYLEAKKEENKEIIDGLKTAVYTQSRLPAFDLYSSQTYLDNILRGGLPLTFKSGQKSQIFYLYSRKHGDLERDYNKFLIQPTYFSQGNGNYRDVNQNRRSDLWFNPEIKEENVVNFYNLIQADGFNPLVVKGSSFSLIDREGFNSKLKSLVRAGNIQGLLAFLAKPFTPGDVILFLEEHKIKLNISKDEFLNLLLPDCEKNQEAEHGEGFWSDHWTYNLDLLESYLGVYPEESENILFKKKIFTYFDNIEIVKPRQEKYTLHCGSIKQLHAIASSAEKKELIHKRKSQPHIARRDFGKGEIYYSTLINKLLCIIANKASSLDPFGQGIEMEADKPNWYDALNGLPALLGSSLNETLELKRLIIFSIAALRKAVFKELAVTEEIYDFLVNLDQLTCEYFEEKKENKDYVFWDKTHLLKEGYRKKINLGFKGDETNLLREDLILILENILKKLSLGIEKSKVAGKGLYYSYFINKVSAYEPINEKFVKPLKFQQQKLPLFLESQVHGLKITSSVKKAQALYNDVKKSGLFDQKLKMYKVCSSLADTAEEIGRCRSFPGGWLENESIWLHMEYKYLLEILRSGLYEEFYQEFKALLIPFQNPKTYGRSILENSSFLASSAFADKGLWGNGFVARLSGSTAEFIHIWLIMNLGMRPFVLNEKNELTLQFKPILSKELFTRKEKTYSFNFLSYVNITYHNPAGKDTFGENKAVIKKIVFKDKDNAEILLSSGTIPPPFAAQIRQRLISKIDIYLG